MKCTCISWKREFGTTELAPDINGELISTSGARPIAGNRIKTASDWGGMWLGEGWWERFVLASNNTNPLPPPLPNFIVGSQRAFFHMDITVYLK